MNQGEFVNWATIIGGFAGFLSFAYVVWEKITTKPKLVTFVRKSYFTLNKDRDTGDWQSSIGVSLEIGNVGSELTTITEVQLQLPEGHVLGSKIHGQMFVQDDYETRVCEKGIAFVDHLKFFGPKQPEWDGTVEGIIILKLLGGNTHKQKVTFKVKKGF